MSFIENILNKLFPKDSNSHKPLIHEVIARKESENQNYQKWLKSMGKYEHVKAIENAYYLSKSNQPSDPEVFIYNSAYSNGFAIPYHPMFSPEEFGFIFDFFKDQVLKMNYRSAGSDRKIKEKEKHLETVEKHYLKPPLNLTKETHKQQNFTQKDEKGSRIPEHINDQNKEKTDQLYGNIIIEHVSINDQPDLIKVMANIYSDRLYGEAKPFDEFVKRLFNS